MSELKKPRSRLQILQDEIFEAQENLTFLFIQRDVAQALQDMTEVEKFNDFIKGVGRRKNVLLELLKIAQNEEEGITYFEIPACIFIKSNSYE